MPLAAVLTPEMLLLPTVGLEVAYVVTVTKVFHEETGIDCLIGEYLAQCDNHPRTTYRKCGSTMGASSLDAATEVWLY